MALRCGCQAIGVYMMGDYKYSSRKCQDVIKVSTGCLIPKGHRLYPEESEIVLWVEPDPTINEYSFAVQRYLDRKAHEMGYDSIFTASTYADEPSVSEFQNEGKSLRQWRSLVWSKCQDIISDVNDGIVDPPSIDELLVMLPAYPIQQ